MSNDLIAMVSMVEQATATETKDCCVESLLDAIRRGRWREAIEEIRRKYRDGWTSKNGSAAGKKAIDPLKKKLSAVMWSGTFSKRGNNSLLRHSGLICADLDALGANRKEVRDKLQTSPYLCACFLSPSGDGLKALFSVAADASRHLASFRAVQAHVRALCSIEIDEACKDVARLCFVSYDPWLYFNSKAKTLEPLPEPKGPAPIVAANIDLSERQKIAGELLGEIDWQTETSGLLRCPGKHLHTTGDAERDCKIDLDKVPTVHCFHNHCRGFLAGINHELRSQIGKSEFKPETCERSELSLKFSEKNCERSELRGGLTSLISQPPGSLELYPAALSRAAFHGIAGDFVARVLPETEADPAALLVQFLAAFGNVVGRTPHTFADGVRHGLNLFSTLCGDSSKSRKGTSLSHVQRLYGQAEEAWSKDCIKHGLSSGEGLIWNVHDSILKTVKGETQVVDEGITDKRLFVVEGEFANVLRVMRREGNTLSPVLRSAWETGKLTTLVKNNPACATDAHVSIVGHITRAELRRLLTETDMANGFGNRFLWVAVKRSKCLPEGGQLPLLADLQTRLQRAIEFGKSVVDKITRSDAARELWASVYPELSEGKPGLLGAVISRAEAQVLRLSCIYALLDCSNVVEVPHLQAALALWRYCEDSARWIFEVGTGDEHADRILAALKVAGQTGLSRSEITADVFNRHATKFDIDQALQLLRSMKLTTVIYETTQGRPTERWFHGARTCEVSEEKPTAQKTASPAAVGAGHGVASI